MARRGSVSSDLRWGLKWGLLFAAIVALWPLALLVIGAVTTFRANGVTFVAVLGLYLSSGVLGGALLGLCRPMLRSQIGAAVVGVLVAHILMAGAALLTQGHPASWDPADWVAIVVTAVPLGAAVGVSQWRMARE
jgi:hypothetical protein